MEWKAAMWVLFIPFLWSKRLLCAYCLFRSFGVKDCCVRIVYSVPIDRAREASLPPCSFK